MSSREGAPITGETLLARAGVGSKYKNVQVAGAGANAPPLPAAPPSKPPKKNNVAPAVTIAVNLSHEIPTGEQNTDSSPLTKKTVPRPPPPPKVATNDPPPRPSKPAPPAPAHSPSTGTVPIQPPIAVSPSATPTSLSETTTSTPSKRSSLSGALSGFLKRSSISTRSFASDSSEPDLPCRSYSGTEGAARLVELEEMMDHEESLTSRVLLREGTLEKLNRDRYAEFHFILTTDALIYCSRSGDKLKLNRTLPLVTLLVDFSESTRPQGCSEFKVLTTIKSFYVRCPSQDIRNSWFSDLHQYAKLAQESTGKSLAVKDMAPCFGGTVTSVLRRLSTQTSGLKLDGNLNKKYSSVEDNTRRMLELEEMMDHEESLTSRVLLREGTLEKLNRDRYAEFHFILTTDALIYCAPNLVGDKLKYHRTLPLSSLLAGHSESSRPNSSHEFKIMTPSKSFYVLAASAADATSWMDDIAAAASYAHHQSGSVPDTSAMAPVWETDDTSTKCSICPAEFTLLNRRHHCRNCGALVCELCSKEKLRTKIDDKRLQRVCSRCAEELKANRKYGVNAYS